MARFGTISFQANSKLDVFQVVEVREDGLESSDEALFRIEDPQFQSDRSWVTGYIPQMIPVNVEGDTATINAWFKAKRFCKCFTLRIYVEYEEVEQLIKPPKDECCNQHEEIHL